MLRDEHPFIAAIMVAFGLKGLVVDTDNVFKSAREISNVAGKLGQTVQAVVDATDEAGDFGRAE